MPVAVAIDGGGSKTDAVAVFLNGGVAARSSGPGTSPHFIFSGTDKNGNISLPWEMLSGGTAGACQVVFTKYCPSIPVFLPAIC